VKRGRATRRLASAPFGGATRSFVVSSLALLVVPSLALLLFAPSFAAAQPTAVESAS
jgi:hypothetical protein